MDMVYWLCLCSKRCTDMTGRFTIDHIGIANVTNDCADLQLINYILGGNALVREQH
jgi:hypothetical protein